MYGILIGLSLISATVAQYESRAGIKADVVFDEDNERFDINAIRVASGNKNEYEDPHRRTLGEGLIKRLADKIRKYHAVIQDSTDVVPQRRHRISKQLNNPVLRSIYDSIKGFKEEYDIKMNSKKKHAEVDDKMMNRLVEVASNSLKDQDLDDNFEKLQGNSFSDLLDGVKDNYSKKLKLLVDQDEGDADRRAAQIVNELHQEIRRNGAKFDLENPIEDLLMHYAYPMKIKLQGFINVPINKNK